MNVKKTDKIINQTADVIRNWKGYADKVQVEKKLKEVIGKTLLVL